MHGFMNVKLTPEHCTEKKPFVLPKANAVDMYWTL